jgi:hypothetical protein
MDNFVNQVLQGVECLSFFSNENTASITFDVEGNAIVVFKSFYAGFKPESL